VNTKAKGFVDASGDPDLAFFAGASTRYRNNGAINLGTPGTRFGPPGSVANDADQRALISSLCIYLWNTPLTRSGMGRRYAPPTRNRSPPSPSIALRNPDNRATIEGVPRGGRRAAARSGVW
jgi:hypothetical protein